MTEVPEHLLRRSQERREALGLATSSGDGGSAPAAASPARTEAATTPAAGEAGAVEAAAPAVTVPDVFVGEPEEVAQAREALRRNRIPLWVAPVLFALPFWALLYAGTFGPRAHDEGPVDPLVLGAEVYGTACASCHGAAGQGGAGPALIDGDSALTFPDEADHVAWVEEGSMAKPKGTPYGAPDRPGGQRVVNAAIMPGFAGQLSPEEIAAVVKYEREQL